MQDMDSKILEAIMFLEEGGKRVITTNSKGALASLAGEAGTRIICPKGVIV